MAEGYSYKPIDENDATAPAEKALASKSTEAVDKFKVFIGDLFKPKEKTEEDEEDDEESESTTEKTGRFSRAWRKLFSTKVVEKQEITDGGVANVREETGSNETAPAQNGLFFELARTEDEVTRSADARRTEESDVADASETIDTEPHIAEAAPTIEAEQKPIHEEELGVLHIQRDRADQDSRIQEEAHTQETAPARDQYYPGGLTSGERYRLWRAEKDAERAKKEAKTAKKTATSSAKKVDKHIKVAKTAERQKPEAVLASTPETVPLVAAAAAERVTRPSVRPEAAKEVMRRSIEKPVERANVTQSERIKTTEKQEDKLPQAHEKSFEKETVYNVAPEVQKVVEKLEDSETNEIAYELSHEHKDMDKAAASQWALLQQQADDQAKAAASALAAALAKDTSLTDKPSSQLPVSSTPANDTSKLYTQALMGGFIAAVVLFAIILTILLVK